MVHAEGCLPAFETDRLLIRPRKLADLDACLAMDRDPRVTRYIPGPWHDPVGHREFVLARMSEAYPAGMGYWTVATINRPSAFLGWILLLPYGDTEEDAVEIGWRFNRANWGNGFASEAAGKVLDHGFRTVGLNVIVADIHPLNLGSIRVAEKIGMNFAGECRVEGELAVRYRAIQKRA